MKIKKLRSHFLTKKLVETKLVHVALGKNINDVVVLYDKYKADAIKIKIAPIAITIFF